MRLNSHKLPTGEFNFNSVSHSANTTQVLTPVGNRKLPDRSLSLSPSRSSGATINDRNSSLNSNSYLKVN